MNWLSVSKTRKRGVHSTRRAAHTPATFWGVKWEDTLWPSMGWKAWVQFVLLKIRRSASDPHHVALGMAIGMWANFLPLPGLGGTLSVTFAWLLRANMMSAFIGQLLGNAWTMPFIWWICYKTGLVFFPIEEHGIGFRSLMANFNMEYFLENWRILARSVLLPVAVGGQIIGIPLAIISYWLTHWEVKRFWAFRRRIKEASQKRHAERKAARTTQPEA